MSCSKCETTTQAIYLLIPRSSFGYLTYCIPCAMEHQRDAMIQLHYWLDKHLTDTEKMGRSKLGK
jgi:hypothetical protein